MEMPITPWWAPREFKARKGSKGQPDHKVRSGRKARPDLKVSQGPLDRKVYKERRDPPVLKARPGQQARRGRLDLKALLEVSQHLPIIHLRMERVLKLWPAGTKWAAASIATRLTC